MSNKMNWVRVHQENMLSHQPSQRSRPLSHRQRNYIRALEKQKGRSVSNLPRTMKGGSDLIERLLALPDVEGRHDPVPPTQPELTPHQVMVAELRERFPQLTPMTANSLVQLFEAMDPLGFAFLLDELMREPMPDDQNQLILCLVRRFLDEIAPVSNDDTTTVVEG